MPIAHRAVTRRLLFEKAVVVPLIRPVPGVSSPSPTALALDAVAARTSRHQVPTLDGRHRHRRRPRQAGGSPGGASRRPPGGSIAHHADGGKRSGQSTTGYLRAAGRPQASPANAVMPAEWAARPIRRRCLQQCTVRDSFRPHQSEYDVFATYARWRSSALRRRAAEALRDKFHWKPQAVTRRRS